MFNALGQAIGFPVLHWSTRARPQRCTLDGQYGQLQPLDCALHAAALWEAFATDSSGADWTYLPYGPFSHYDDFYRWLDSVASAEDPLFYCVLDHTGRACGLASLMRIDPSSGVIEVGHIHFAPSLQRTRLATEAMYLLMRYVFAELGYRRYEWKCDALNAPSRQAAQRLGFRYEGTFRQAAVYKGRNRDTAWFSIIDRQWPALDSAFQRWLSADNFDRYGQQRQSLSTLTGESASE